VKRTKFLAALIMVAYPLLVYGGLRVLQPRWLALALGGVVLLREIPRWRSGVPSPLLLPLALIGGILTLAIAFNEGRFFLFVPVLINAALFVSFARTLITGPSMVESLARRRFVHLPSEHVGYCRRVTEVWCVFFLVNGGVILWLALQAPIAQWALYTGLVAYLLVGVLFAAEETYRAWRFRRYQGDVTDVFFRKLFPPKHAQ
jgi:uncharacterized membrane protein